MEDNGENERRDEILLGRKPVDIKIANKVMKSICKIIIKGINKNVIYGTGFFMKISNSFKCLITNYHVISPNVINQNIQLEIWNQKKMKLNISNCYIGYFEKLGDITIIQIKNSDSICKYIEFLGYDSNYIDNGYNIYKNTDIFTVQHPKGKDAACASGIIKDINFFIDSKNNKIYEFDHDISTEPGSSGCPIILLNNNINLIQVIGIHKEGDNEENVNGGTFIGEIINYINKNYINIDNNIDDNNLNKEKNNEEEGKKENNGYLNIIANNNNRDNDNNNLNINSNARLLENETYYTDEEIAEIAKKLNSEESNFGNELSDILDSIRKGVAEVLK